MTIYGILKYIHILSAILAVGFSASYTVWLWRAQQQPAHLLYTLAGVRFLDRRFTNIAYVFLLLAGLAMVLISGAPLTRFWIAGALVLYSTVVIIGFAAYAPLFRKLTRLLETEGASSPSVWPLLQRSFLYNTIAGLVILAIIALMVFKPTF